MKTLIHLLEAVKPVRLVVTADKDFTQGQGGLFQFDTIKEAVQAYLDQWEGKYGFNCFIETKFGSFKMLFVVPDRFEGMSRAEAKKQFDAGVKPYTPRSIWEMWLKKPSVDPIKVRGTEFAKAVIAANPS